MLALWLALLGQVARPVPAPHDTFRAGLIRVRFMQERYNSLFLDVCCRTLHPVQQVLAALRDVSSHSRALVWEAIAQCKRRLVRPWGL